MEQFEFFKTTMPSTRKADFYLGCLDGCIFIDFNKAENNCIALVRISFDGYGCCNLDGTAAHLNDEESALFLDQMKKTELDQNVITQLVKRSISINMDKVCPDAIEEYGLG